MEFNGKTELIRWLFEKCNHYKKIFDLCHADTSIEDIAMVAASFFGAHADTLRFLGVDINDIEYYESTTVK